MNIKELAEQATTYIEPTSNSGEGWIFDKEKFAELVAAHEREECAKVCEAQKVYGERVHKYPLLACAAAIRARSKA